MTPADVLATVVRPALEWMGVPYASPEAEMMLLAIQQQEDSACTRCQVGGPARGLWMFEAAGVYGVLHHERTADDARRAIGFLRYGYGDMADRAADICDALQYYDRLAAAFARLLLWSDPRPLPKVGEEDGAWNLYLRLWRPGRPRPEAWTASYAAALEAVAAAETVA